MLGFTSSDLLRGVTSSALRLLDLTIFLHYELSNYFPLQRSYYINSKFKVFCNSKMQKYNRVFHVNTMNHLHIYNYLK